MEISIKEMLMKGLGRAGSGETSIDDLFGGPPINRSREIKIGSNPEQADHTSDLSRLSSLAMEAAGAAVEVPSETNGRPQAAPEEPAKITKNIKNILADPRARDTLGFGGRYSRPRKAA